MDASKQSARDLVQVVLVEALGSSITPFVPVPFVDDYLLERLLRRIARKAIARRGEALGPEVAKALVEGYVKAGASPISERALVAAARFVVRKVAVVLDVKKGHDVFGEAIAFALALDVALECEAVRDVSARSVGAAIHRATQSLGSAAIEVLTRAGREAFAGTDGAPTASTFARVSEAIGKQVDEARASLDHLMRYELMETRRR